QAGDHDQPVARQIKVDVLEIVGTGTANADGVHRDRWGVGWEAGEAGGRPIDQTTEALICGQMPGKPAWDTAVSAAETAGSRADGQMGRGGRPVDRNRLNPLQFRFCPPSMAGRPKNNYRTNTHTRGSTCTQS